MSGGKKDSKVKEEADKVDYVNPNLKAPSKEEFEANFRRMSSATIKSAPALEIPTRTAQEGDNNNIAETSEMKDQRLFDEQSTTEALTIGAGNAIINAGSSIVGGVLTPIIGTANIVSDVAQGNITASDNTGEQLLDSFINNPLNAGLAKISEYYNQANPVYSDPKNSSLLDDITSAKFFSEAISSAGYTFGGMGVSALAQKGGVRLAQNQIRKSILKATVEGSTKSMDELLESTITDPAVRKMIKDATVMNGYKSAAPMIGASTGRLHESILGSFEDGQKAKKEMEKSLEGREDLSPEQKDKMVNDARLNAQSVSFSLNMMLGYSDMKQSAKLFNSFGDGVEEVSKYWKEGLKQFAQEGSEEYLQDRITKIAVDNQFIDGTGAKMLEAFSSVASGVTNRDAQLAFVSGGITGAPMGVIAGLKSYDKQQKEKAEKIFTYEQLVKQLKPNERIELDKNLKYAELEEQKKYGMSIISGISNIADVSPETSSFKVPNSNHTLGSLKALSISNPTEYAYESERIKNETKINVESAANYQLSETVFAAMDTGNLENLKLELEAIAKSSNEEISNVIGEKVTDNNKQEKLKSMSARIDKAEKIYNAAKSSLPGADSKQIKESAMIMNDIEFLSSVKAEKIYYNPLSLDLADLGVLTSLDDFQSEFGQLMNDVIKKHTYTKKQINDSLDDSPLAIFKDKVKNRKEDTDEYTDDLSVIQDQSKLINEKSFSANIRKAVNAKMGTDPSNKKEREETIKRYEANIPIHEKIQSDIRKAYTEHAKVIDTVKWQGKEKSKAVKDAKDIAELQNEKEKPAVKIKDTVKDLLTKYGYSNVNPSSVFLPAALESFIVNQTTGHNSFGVDFNSFQNISAALITAIDSLPESSSSVIPDLLIIRLIRKYDSANTDGSWSSVLTNSQFEKAMTVLQRRGDNEQRVPAFKPKPDSTGHDVYLHIEANRGNLQETVENNIVAAIYAETVEELKDARDRLQSLLRHRGNKLSIDQYGLVNDNGELKPAIVDGVLKYAPSMLVTEESLNDQMFLLEMELEEVKSKLSGKNNNKKSTPVDSGRTIGDLDPAIVKAVIRNIETFSAYTDNKDNLSQDVKDKIAEDFKNLLLNKDQVPDSGEFFFRLHKGNPKSELIEKTIKIYESGAASATVYRDTAIDSIQLVYLPTKDSEPIILSYNDSQFIVDGVKISSPSVKALIEAVGETPNALFPFKEAVLPGGEEITYNYAQGSKNTSETSLNEVNENLFQNDFRHVFFDTPNGYVTSCYVMLKGKKGGASHRTDVQGTEVSQDDFVALDRMSNGVYSDAEKSELEEVVARVFTNGLTFQGKLSSEMNANISAETLMQNGTLGHLVSKLCQKYNINNTPFSAIRDSANRMLDEGKKIFNSVDDQISFYNICNEKINAPIGSSLMDIENLVSDDFYIELVALHNQIMIEKTEAVLPNMKGLHLGINIHNDKKSGASYPVLAVIPYTLEYTGNGTESKIKYYNDESQERTEDGKDAYLKIKVPLNQVLYDGEKVSSFIKDGDSVISSFVENGIQGDTVLTFLRRSGSFRNALIPNVKRSQNPTRSRTHSSLEAMNGITMSPINVANPINTIRARVNMKPNEKSESVKKSEQEPKQTENTKISNVENPPQKPVLSYVDESDDLSLDDLEGYKIDNGENKLRDKENLSKARRWLSRNLPSGISIKEADGFIERALKQAGAIGAYSNAMIYLDKEAGGSVLYHEAFHAVFNAILSPEERSHFLAIAEDEIGPVTQEDLDSFVSEEPISRAKLSKTRLKNLYLEEYMADQFAEYKISKDAQPWWKQLWDGLLEWIGFFKQNNNKINELFTRIDRGKFAKSEVLGTGGLPLHFKVVRKSDGSAINVIEQSSILKSFINYVQVGDEDTLSNEKTKSKFKVSNKKWLISGFNDFIAEHKKVYNTVLEATKGLEAEKNPDKAVEIKKNKTLLLSMRKRMESFKNIDDTAISLLLNEIIDNKASFLDTTMASIDEIIEDEMDEEKYASLGDYDATEGNYDLTPDMINLKRILSVSPMKDANQITILTDLLSKKLIASKTLKLISNSILFANYADENTLYAAAVSKLSDQDSYSDFLSAIKSLCGVSVVGDEELVNSKTFSALYDLCFQDKKNKATGLIDKRKDTFFARKLRKVTNYSYVPVVNIITTDKGTELSVSGAGGKRFVSETYKIQESLNNSITRAVFDEAQNYVSNILSLMKSGDPEILNGMAGNAKEIAFYFNNIGLPINEDVILSIVSSVNSKGVRKSRQAFISSVTGFFKDLSKNKNTIANATSLGDIVKNSSAGYLTMFNGLSKYYAMSPLVTVVKQGDENKWPFQRMNTVIEKTKEINNATNIADLADDGIAEYIPYFRDSEVEFGINGSQLVPSIDNKRVELATYTGSQYFGEFNKYGDKSPGEIFLDKLRLFSLPSSVDGIMRRLFVPFVMERKNIEYANIVKSPYHDKKTGKTKLYNLAAPTKAAPGFKYEVSDFTANIFYEMFVANARQIKEYRESGRKDMPYKGRLQDVIAYLEKYVDKDFNSDAVKSEILSRVKSELRKSFNELFTKLQSDGIIIIDNNTNIGELDKPRPKYLPEEVKSENKLRLSSEKPGYGNGFEKTLGNLLDFHLESLLYNNSADHIVRGDDRMWMSDSKKYSKTEVKKALIAYYDGIVDENNGPIINDFVDRNTTAMLDKAKRGAAISAASYRMDTHGQTILKDGVISELTQEEEDSFVAVRLNDVYVYRNKITKERYRDDDGNYEFEKKLNLDSTKYDEITITDGQAYADVNHMKLWMVSTGKISNEHDEALITRLIMGDEFSNDRSNDKKPGYFSLAEMEYLANNHILHINSIKDVFHDGYAYLKQSTFFLPRQLTSIKEKDPEIVSILEDQFSKDGVRVAKIPNNKTEYFKDTINGHWYKSGPVPLKNGMFADRSKLHARLNYMQSEGASVGFHPSGEKHKITDNKITLKHKYHGIQTDTPSGKSSVIDGTQLQALIMSVIKATDKIKSSEASSISDELLDMQKAVREISFDKIFSELLHEDYKTNGKGVLTKQERLNLSVLYKKLKKQNINTGKDLLASMFEEVDGIYVHRDTGELSHAIKNAINSLVKNKVLKQKVFGDKFYCVSAYGFNIAEEVNGEMVSRPLKIHRINNGKAEYAECIIPAKTAKLYNLSIGSIIPEEVCIALGIRIPTETPHSVIPLKIVEFLPPYMGSVLVVPDEFVLNSGMDFDIDSLFVNMMDYEWEEDTEGTVELRVISGKVDKNSFGVAIDSQHNKKMFADYVVEMAEAFSVEFDVNKKPLESINFKDSKSNLYPIWEKIAIHEDKYPSTYSEWLLNPKVSSRGLKNKQLELRLSTFDAKRIEEIDGEKVVSYPQMEAANKPADIQGLIDSSNDISKFMGLETTAALRNSVLDMYIQSSSQRAGKPLVGIAVYYSNGATLFLSYENDFNAKKNTLPILTIGGNPVDFEGGYVIDVALEDGAWSADRKLNETRLNLSPTLVANTLDDAKAATSDKNNYTIVTLSAAFGGITLGHGTTINGLINNTPIIVLKSKGNKAEYNKYVDEISFIAFLEDTNEFKNSGLSREEFIKKYHTDKDGSIRAKVDSELSEIIKEQKTNNVFAVEDLIATFHGGEGRNSITSYGNIADSILSDKAYDNQKGSLLVNRITPKYAKQLFMVHNYFRLIENHSESLGKIQKAYSAPLKGLDKGSSTTLLELSKATPVWLGIHDVLTDEGSLSSSLSKVFETINNVISNELIRESDVFKEISDMCIDKRTYDKDGAKEKIGNYLAGFLISSQLIRKNMLDVTYMRSSGTSANSSTASRNEFVSALSKVVIIANTINSRPQDLASVPNPILTAEILFGYNGFNESEARKMLIDNAGSVINNDFIKKIVASSSLSENLLSFNRQKDLSISESSISESFFLLPEKFQNIVMSQIYFEGLTWSPQGLIRYVPTLFKASKLLNKFIDEVNNDIINKAHDIGNIDASFEGLDNNLTREDLAYVIFMNNKSIFTSVAESEVNLDIQNNTRFDNKKTEYFVSKGDKSVKLMKRLPLELANGGAQIIEVLPSKLITNSRSLITVKSTKAKSVTETNEWKDFIEERVGFDSLFENNILITFGVNDLSGKRKGLYMELPSVSGKQNSATTFYSNVNQDYPADMGVFPNRFIGEDKAPNNLIVIEDFYNEVPDEFGLPGEDYHVMNPSFSYRSNNTNVGANNIKRISKKVTAAVNQHISKILLEENPIEFVSLLENFSVITSNTQKMYSSFMTEFSSATSNLVDYTKNLTKDVAVIVQEHGAITEEELLNAISVNMDKSFPETVSLAEKLYPITRYFNERMSELNPESIPLDTREIVNKMTGRYGYKGVSNMIKDNRAILRQGDDSAEFRDFVNKIVEDIDC